MKILTIFLLSIASLIADKKPNMVFIIADDCTYRDLEVYGGQARTPNLNKLAAEGIKFQRCFQAAPMCSPTRHNIYTGLYPVKSGAWPNHTQAYPHVKSIVHHLEPLGYKVYQAGKKHISPQKVFPFISLGNNKSPNFTEIEKVIKSSAVKQQPFCMFVCSNEPHTPWNKGDASAYPPEKIKLPPYIVDTPVVRENFSRYLAEVTYFDDEVGKLVNLIDKYELKENTLIMVVSEQGNAFPFAKWTCYDSGLQAGMIVRWPGKIKANSIANAMVEYVDITPTFIDIAGGKAISPLDGKSFKKVLSGETDKHKEHVYGIMTTRGIINGPEAYAIRSVRGERFKLIINLNHENKFTNACTTSKLFLSMQDKAKNGDKTAQKLVKAYQKRPAIELYDIQKDPLEMNNIADNPEYTETIKTLQAKLTSWMDDQGDKGIETEMKAKERQGARGKKK